MGRNSPLVRVIRDSPLMHLPWSTWAITTKLRICSLLLLIFCASAVVLFRGIYQFHLIYLFSDLGFAGHLLRICKHMGYSVNDRIFLSCPKEIDFKPLLSYSVCSITWN